MYNFDFYNPTHIIFGKNRFSDLKKNIPSNLKVLILYGGGSIKKNGTYEQVIDALKGYDIREFGGVEANPRFTTLMKAVEMVKKENIDFILAVGGGSVMDGAKFVAIAANYEGDNCEDLLYVGWVPAPVKKVTPLGFVATLPATGSEMNAGAVISHNDGKYGVYSPMAFPKFSLLDP